ncbi:MAG: fibro-slime domain-containing protein [Deltaproteobacteria bacterium]|nr:fibro-slime domain-containing protein [Deltaproteobacteria bacterium]
MLAGCGSVYESPGCTDDELSCEGDVLMNCNGGNWKEYTNCSDIGQICTVFEGVAQCIAGSGGTDSDSVNLNDSETGSGGTDYDTEKSDTDTWDTMDSDTIDSDTIETGSDTIIDSDSGTESDSASDSDTGTIITCSDNPCDPDHGTCTDVTEGYSCGCENGWHLDGNLCVIDPDCTDSEVRIGSTICGINGAGYISQVCTLGEWVDTLNCIDDDICKNGNTLPGETPCGNGGFLEEICISGAWYTTSNCINEIPISCADNPCDINATCVDGTTTFSCTCNSGWSGDGLNCIDDNECILGTDDCDDINGYCTNIDGGFTCGCNNGFHLSGSTCEADAVCTEDDIRIGATVCGINKGGYLVQLCSGGFWDDTTTCIDDDVCLNGSYRDGATSCGTGGVLEQLCIQGSWNNTSNCVNEIIDTDSGTDTSTDTSSDSSVDTSDSDTDIDTSPVIPGCGNGVLEPAEECDDGNIIDGDGCSPLCTRSPDCASTGVCTALCGDAIVMSQEACDDGNLINGDGCSSVCTIETGFTCTPGNAVNYELPIVYRDFSSAHPDFEPGATGCEDPSTGMLMNTLDPVTRKPRRSSNNAGTGCAYLTANTGTDRFLEWYSDSAPEESVVTGTMTLWNEGGNVYGNRWKDDGTSWVTYNLVDSCYTPSVCVTPGPGEEFFDVCPVPYYDYYPCVAEVNRIDGNPTFFPLDNLGNTPVSEYNIAKIPTPIYDGGWAYEDGEPEHNFHFTSELRFWFEYHEEEGQVMSLGGDDDVWVFVNGILALDLGGIHVPLEGTVDLDDQKTLLGLKDGQIYEFAVFHAERQTEGSSYQLILDGFDLSPTFCTQN